MYGTLRKGFGLNGVLGDVEMVGIGELKDFEMYSCGFYPMIIRGSGSIIGEIYNLDDGLNYMKNHRL